MKCNEYHCKKEATKTRTLEGGEIMHVCDEHYAFYEQGNLRLKIKPDWHQSCVDCPDANCDGMLLQSIYFHEMKCSTCGKYWMEISHFVITEKPEGADE